ncbi:NAD(P)/FAD-dependent oxidoreductase [Pseudalkalibacillus caeni]|uniref:NAD(P)/FAD-dependent oxidoreductase n=1 Tax=Exobacillus caeni TaxID=2574798 RepID=A0A5R9F9P4_9BACL|nr:NAD(P)/FAD-dependent oxidoreductase [Pseudalkalibacillus caeni]TLS38960.1 NAD(P)/FAD-dependent oxidoreductase [Pseudalkalibacillus caeni]
MTYDCIIVGGGIAGLQAAIQLGRYKRNILVIDSDDGRSTLCRSYHNILGWPDGVSGEHLRKLGRRQATELDVAFREARVEQVNKDNSGHFVVSDQNGEQYKGKCMLLATGVKDRIPPIPNIVPCLGLTVYVCPDCDGYEVSDRKTVVMGSGNVGANMAITLSYWTDDLIYVNHELVELDEKTARKLKEKNIRYIDQKIAKVITEEEGTFLGVELKNGETVEGERGFVAFGGNEVKSGLIKELGIERFENKHIVIDPRTKMTSVENLWAAGDVVAHSELVSTAMGDGSQAAIWIQKKLLEMDN